MRRMLLMLAVLSLFVGGLVSAGTVKYGNLSFHEVDNSKELQELVSSHNGEYFFLFYNSQTCPACGYMKTDVFPTPTAEKALKNLVLVSIDVYRGREITTLRYRVYDPVLVIQPENAGYYKPQKPGEEISVGVPGTPTMVIFKAVNGTMVLRGVAVGALNPQGLAYFVDRATGGEMKRTPARPTSDTGGSSEPKPSNGKTNLGLAVLLPVFSAGILSVFSPCVLPVIIGTLSLTFANRNVGAVVAGMVASFALLGALVGGLGEYAAQIQGALYLLGGLGFIVVGASLVSERVSERIERFLSFSPPADGVARKRGLVYDFFLGSALGATWLGCIAPYVGFAVITAALSRNTLSGVIVMGTYGLGMGLTVYLLTESKELGGWVNRKFLSGRLSLSGGGKVRWEIALGVTLIALGLLMLTELTPLKLWSGLFESLSKL